MIKDVFDRNNIVSHKVAIILFTLFAYFYFKPFLLVFFPGILFFFYTELKTNFFENFLYSIALSISYWIVGFWLLRYIPISLYNFFLFSVVVSNVLVLIRGKLEFSYRGLTKKDVISLVFVLLIPLLYVPLYQQFLAPAGADMSTHSYIARLIAEKNTFPVSYEPIAPSETFGSSAIGLPILIASFYKVHTFTMAQSALIATIFTYFLFAAAVYLFLVKYFSKVVSFLSVFSVIWLGVDVNAYLGWGGIPTILSIALLVFALCLALRIIDTRQFTVKNSFIVALIAYGSFTSHHIPPVVGAYFLLAILIFEFKKIIKEINKVNSRLFIYLILFLLIFSIPFLSNLKLPSIATLEYIKYWQRVHEYVAWKGAVYSIPFYLQNRIGLRLFLMSSIGIFLSLKDKGRHSYWYVLSILTSVILIINSQYWILPLSPLLYPDRVLTIAMIPFSYFIAISYQALYEFLRRYVKTNKIFSATSLVAAVAAIFLSVTFTYDFVFNYREFYDTMNQNVSVTRDDLNAFRWISENTSVNDVFQNNYGDSGIWIPALAYRKIMVYDAIPYDIEEFAEGVKSLKPTYLYLGSKTVYPGDIQFVEEKININPVYELKYASGKAKVYKIKY